MLQAAYCKDENSDMWPSEPRISQLNPNPSLHCNLLKLPQKLNQVASHSFVASTLTAQNSQEPIPEKAYVNPKGECE